MKRCERCGKENADESNFCHCCGNKLNYVKKNNNINKKKVSKPIYKKIWFWILISYLVFTIPLTVWGITSNDDPNSSGDFASNESNPNGLNYIGDEVVCSNWKIIVDGVETKDMISDVSRSTYFYITFYATNISSKQDPFKASYISISNSQATYKNLEFLGNSYFDTSRVCQPFVEEKFIMVFEVPHGSNYTDFTFNVKFIINSTSIALKHKN